MYKRQQPNLSFPTYLSLQHPSTPTKKINENVFENLTSQYFKDFPIPNHWEDYSSTDTELEENGDFILSDEEDVQVFKYWVRPTKEKEIKLGEVGKRYSVKKLRHHFKQNLDPWHLKYGSLSRFDLAKLLTLYIEKGKPNLKEVKKYFDDKPVNYLRYALKTGLKHFSENMNRGLLKKWKKEGIPEKDLEKKISENKKFLPEKHPRLSKLSILAESCLKILLKDNPTFKDKIAKEIDLVDQA